MNKNISLNKYKFLYFEEVVNFLYKKSLFLDYDFKSYEGNDEFTFFFKPKDKDLDPSFFIQFTIDKDSVIISVQENKKPLDILMDNGTKFKSLTKKFKVSIINSLTPDRFSKLLIGLLGEVFK